MFFPTMVFVFQIHIVWEVEYKCKKLEKNGITIQNEIHMF